MNTNMNARRRYAGFEDSDHTQAGIVWAEAQLNGGGMSVGFREMIPTDKWDFEYGAFLVWWDWLARQPYHVRKEAADSQAKKAGYPNTEEQAKAYAEIASRYDKIPFETAYRNELENLTRPSISW